MLTVGMVDMVVEEVEMVDMVAGEDMEVVLDRMVVGEDSVPGLLWVLD